MKDLNLKKLKIETPTTNNFFCVCFNNLCFQKFSEDKYLWLEDLAENILQFIRYKKKILYYTSGGIALCLEHEKNIS